jgi:hypothetical protein
VFQVSLEHISVCCQIETDALIDRVNDYTYGTVDVEKSHKTVRELRCFER